MTTFRFDPMGRDVFTQLINPILEMDFVKEGVDNFMNNIKNRETCSCETNSKGITTCLDVYEDEQSYEVVLEIPGVSKENISIFINSDDLLEIKGTKKLCETECDKRKILYSERKSGEFTRTIKLDKKINTDTIKAKFVNGELFITISKLEEEKPKQVEIQIE